MSGDFAMYKANLILSLVILEFKLYYKRMDLNSVGRLWVRPAEKARGRNTCTYSKSKEFHVSHTVVQSS